MSQAPGYSLENQLLSPGMNRSQSAYLTPSMLGQGHGRSRSMGGMDALNSPSMRVPTGLGSPRMNLYQDELLSEAGQLGLQVPYGSGSSGVDMRGSHSPRLSPFPYSGGPNLIEDNLFYGGQGDAYAAGSRSRAGSVASQRSLGSPRYRGGGGSGAEIYDDL